MFDDWMMQLPVARKTQAWDRIARPVQSSVAAVPGGR